MPAPLHILYEKAVKALGAFPNVSGIGFGAKEQAGVATRIFSWRVYVSKKQPLSLLNAGQCLPQSLFGIPTDVIQKHDTVSTKGVPVFPGASIANSKGVPGTLGCTVSKKEEKNGYFLTNAHVLLGKKAAVNEPVWLVDYAADGTYRCRLIGKTENAMIGTVNYQGCTHFVDCAIGKFEPAETLPRRLKDAALKLRAPQNAGIGEKVKKIGAGSGVTYGVVSDIYYPDNVFIDKKHYEAPGQILISPLTPGTPFSVPGDSGALLLNEEDNVIGLLWGCNAKGEGIACHILPVLEALQIKIEEIKPGFFHLLKQKIFSRYEK